MSRLLTAQKSEAVTSVAPRHLVLVLNGYGIRAQVNAGHLLLHDGIADERRIIRLPRVNHGLKRLVMIGSDGFITLEALRWISDIGAAFVMLDRRGKGWEPATLPAWLTRDTYVKRVVPALASVAKSQIRSTLGVSEPYSADIRTGKRIPHPRHWLALAQLVGVSVDG